MPDMIRPAVVHGSDTLNLGDFLAAMKRSRRLRPLLLDAFVENYLVNGPAGPDWQSTTRNYSRRPTTSGSRTGWPSAEQTSQWFQREAISADDFAAGLERDLLVEKLRRAIADPRVPEVFDQNTARFARVKLKRLLVATETEARQVIDDVANGRTSFEDAARQKSLDLQTKNAGGDAGTVRRVDLAQPLGDAVFKSEAGKLVGPVQAGRVPGLPGRGVPAGRVGRGDQERAAEGDLRRLAAARAEPPADPVPAPGGAERGPAAGEKSDSLKAQGRTALGFRSSPPTPERLRSD